MKLFHHMMQVFLMKHVYLSKIF